MESNSSGNSMTMRSTDAGTMNHVKKADCTTSDKAAVRNIDARRKRQSRESEEYREVENKANRIARKQKKQLPGVLDKEAAAKRRRKIEKDDNARNTIVKENNFKNVKETRRRKKLSRNELMLEDLKACDSSTTTRKYPVRKAIILGHLHYVSSLKKTFIEANDVICKREIFTTFDNLIKHGVLEILHVVLNRFVGDRDVLLSVIGVLRVPLRFGVYYKEWITNIRLRSHGLFPILINLLKHNSDIAEKVTEIITGLLKYQQV